MLPTFIYSTYYNLLENFSSLPGIVYVVLGNGGGLNEEFLALLQVFQM